MSSSPSRGFSAGSRSRRTRLATSFFTSSCFAEMRLTEWKLGDPSKADERRLAAAILSFLLRAAFSHLFAAGATLVSSRSLSSSASSAVGSGCRAFSSSIARVALSTSFGSSKRSQSL